MIQKPYHLMIVDDEPDITEMLRELIDDQFPGQFRITEWHNVNEALDHVKSNDVRIVLSDMNMPEMTGSEFLSEVFKLQKGIRFQMITGSNLYSDLSVAFMDGAHGYVMKPFTPEEIHRALARTILDIRSWEDALNKLAPKV